MKIKTTKDRQKRIALRQRKRISGTPERPRLRVFRSVSHIYAQVIDDMTGQTIASASSTEPSVKAGLGGAAKPGNRAGAQALGRTIAERLKEKGIEAAKKSLIRVPLQGTTVPHPVLGRFGAGQVLLKPAPDGTGIIAGGGVRAVVESAGISNVLTKSIGSANPHNVVRATFQALSELKDPSFVRRLRGKEEEEAPAPTEPAAV